MSKISDIIDDGINSPVRGRSRDDRGSKQALASPSKQTKFHCSSIARSTAQRMAEALAWIGEQTLTCLDQPLTTSPLWSRATAAKVVVEEFSAASELILIQFPWTLICLIIVFSGTTMQHFLSMVSLTVINNNVLCFRTN